MNVVWCEQGVADEDVKDVRHAVAGAADDSAARVHGNEHAAPRRAHDTLFVYPQNLWAVGYIVQFAREELHPPSRRAPHLAPGNRRHPVAPDLSNPAIERTPHSLWTGRRCVPDNKQKNGQTGKEF